VENEVTTHWLIKVIVHATVGLLGHHTFLPNVLHDTLSERLSRGHTCSNLERQSGYEEFVRQTFHWFIFGSIA
jgi:hypothetical protein